MDTDEVLKGLARESVKQGENLRSAVRELTLNALKGRELTLSEIKRVVRSVSEGVNLGATASKLDGERVFSEALAGMDDAVLKAVQANHLALQQLSAQGQSLRESHLQKALDDLRSVPRVTASLGIGFWAVIAGTVLVLLGGVMAMQRRRL